MRWAWALALLALVVAGSAVPAAPGDRLAHFKELARRYADAPDPALDDPVLAELFAVVDDEVVENLRAGGLFASVAFVQERLEAFSDEWGGAAFKVAAPSGGTTDALMLGLFTLTRGEPRGSLRIYGRSDGTGSLIAAVTREGSVEVQAWPNRHGTPQFLASWLGPATGRRSRTLHLELWRQRAGGGAGRVWSSGDAFPEGLPAIDFAAKAGQILVRYEVHYPGWKPGCAGETEQEDVYRQSAGAPGLALVRRRVVNGWHRELQSAVTRFFGALGADDRKALAELVPDASLRARLPRELQADAVCDERNPAAPATVIVAATREHAQQRVPWSLAWRRGPSGWRLAAATPVLQ